MIGTKLKNKKEMRVDDIMKLVIWVMYAVLSIYCLLDYFLTIQLAQVGGIEINPVIIWIIGENENWMNVFYAKSLVLILIGILLFICMRNKMWITIKK